MGFRNEHTTAQTQQRKRTNKKHTQKRRHHKINTNFSTDIRSLTTDYQHYTSTQVQRHPHTNNPRIMSTTMYDAIVQDEKEAAILASQVEALPTSTAGAPTGNVTVEAKRAAEKGASSSSVTPTKGTRQQVRGAGVGAGLAGLVIGGPILAVIGGYAAAKLAETSDSKAGKFCRKTGRKVAKGIVQGCDFIKEKLQPDGEEDDDSDLDGEKQGTKPSPSKQKTNKTETKTGKEKDATIRDIEADDDDLVVVDDTPRKMDNKDAMN